MSRGLGSRLGTRILPVLVLAAHGCGGGAAPPASAPRPAAAQPTRAAPADRTAASGREPALAPEFALLYGLLPLRTLGADTFRLRHPAGDGRGVLVAILDSGVDPGLPGLRRTSTGQPKLLDVRDFSGEGRIALRQVEPGLDGTIAVDGQRLTGFGRVAGMASPPYYAGAFTEVALGDSSAADVNGNGRGTDRYPVVVAKSVSGWFAVTDTDGDGDLADERPVHDFLIAGEVLTYRSGPDGAPGPMTIAVNVAEIEGRPVLDFVFDNSGHGTHVAGIAAGHDLFGVEGFDGLAPGAQLLGLKISNNARGGVSVTGSMVRAMNYATDFAERRAMPLVLNLSFGVGNEIEGTAAIDSLIDEFALRHPDVLFVISAGNDGPGISTLGFPGSAAHALSVCALFPGVFAGPPEPGVPPVPDVMGWWSARGGELAKPDVCAPGVAYSNVPRWHTGHEISGGTSMAAPQISGAAAVLLSAMAQRGRALRAIDLKQALRAAAAPVPDATVLDAGAGVPELTAAFHWLLAGHQTGVYEIQAVPTGGNRAAGTAAYRRAGLASPGDTLQPFVVASVGGQPAARLLLQSDAAWLRAPALVEPGGRPVTVTLTYDGDALRVPGLYVGTVWALPATDTTAGPAFGLSNTIIVPRSLETPFEARRTIAAGEIARYFLEVPADAGGLVLELEVAQGAPPTSLYLFEPSGRPYRGGNTVSVGGRDSTSGALIVTANDIRAGVYEAVVVAPPAEAVRATLRAILPPVAVTGLTAGPAATVRNATAATVTATVSAHVVGAVTTRQVAGSRAQPVEFWTRPPPWAAALTVDVTLPVPLWGMLTDFGVTVFDASGRRVKDGPLNYADGRLEMELDTALVGVPLMVELLPGFAHLEPPAAWTGEVMITYRRGAPLRLAVLGESLQGRVELPPGASHTVRFQEVPGDSTVDAGQHPLVEVRAETDPSVRSVRRGPVRQIP